MPWDQSHASPVFLLVSQLNLSVEHRRWLQCRGPCLEIMQISDRIEPQGGRGRTSTAHVGGGIASAIE